MESPSQRVKIAVQKTGRLTDHSIDLLERCGLKITKSKDQLICYGENMPIDLLLVRDDFWMSITRFIKLLDERLVEGVNSTPIDLFDRAHAKWVIQEFGRAYGRLPYDDLSQDHKAFLELASDSLAVDGRVSPVRLAVFAEMVKNTNKPLIFIADCGQDIAQIYDIACLIAGGEDELHKKPFLLNYSEAISPLHFPQNVMEKLIFCAEKKIPICLPSGSNAGGGAPVTLAGAMALGIAENLVGLVVHQLAGKGAPFLFGPNVTQRHYISLVITKNRHNFRHNFW